MKALRTPTLSSSSARAGLWPRLAAAVFILALLLAHHPAAAQSTNPITGSGEACADFAGSQACFDFELTFLVMGGDVSAVGYRQQEITQNGVTVQVTTNLAWVGTFQGGDGGTASGTWVGESTMVMPGGESTAQSNEGTWEGTLYADGTGSGTWTGELLGQTGTWSISYPAEAFQAGLPPGPTSTPGPTPTPAAAQPSPEPTEPGPTPTASGPPAGSNDSPEEPDDPAPAEPDPDLESDAAAAAVDPRSALAGGAAGALLGGLLAFLASRGAELADSGSALLSDLQQAADSLPGEGRPVSPLPDSQVLRKAAAGLSYSDRLAASLQQKMEVPHGFNQGNFRKLAAAAEYGYEGFGHTLTALNTANNLNEMRGRTSKSLKYLGPISITKGFVDRTYRLLEERGDEPFLYKASTVLEATLVEGAKTVLTKNPFVATADQLIGYAMGKAPSDYIADESANFIPKYYKRWKDLQAPHSISNLERTRQMFREMIGEAKAEIEAQIARGEISPEEGRKLLIREARTFKNDYSEICYKLNQHNTSFGD